MLVDEQFGGDIPEQAHAAGLKLAMPVEKSGQNHFDFEYGDDFGAHIEKFNPDFSKVLVRYNPEDPDVDMNREQLTKLKRLADWLHEHDRKFLFELLVPATEAQLAKVDGDTDRYDAELRPELMRRTIEDTQNFGCEVDIWKIEGVDERSDAEMLAKQARSGEGREGVTCVLLGRGAVDREGRAVAAGGLVGRRLHRLRDRPLDLVGRAPGLPRRGPRPGRGRVADRRQLPALRRGLRGPEGRVADLPRRWRTIRCAAAVCNVSCDIGRLAAWRCGCVRAWLSWSRSSGRRQSSTETDGNRCDGRPFVVPVRAPVTTGAPRARSATGCWCSR